MVTGNLGNLILTEGFNIWSAKCGWILFSANSDLTYQPQIVAEELYVQAQASIYDIIY